MRVHAGHVTGSCLAAALVALLVASSTAEAMPLVFLDRSSFQDAVKPNALITFDEIELELWETSPDGSTPPQRSYCGPLAGQCLATVDRLLVIDSSDSAPLPDPFGGNLKLSVGPGAFLSLTGLSPFTAIGFDVNSTSHAVLNSAASFYSPDGFIGFLFPTPVNFLGIGVGSALPFSNDRWANQSVTIDNVAIRTVPEPSTLLLFSSVFVLVSGGRYVVQRLRPKH